MVHRCLSCAWSVFGSVILNQLCVCVCARYDGLGTTELPAQKFWNLDRPLFQQIVYKVSYRWQCEHPMFFAGGASRTLLLLPIILRSNKGEWNFTISFTNLILRICFTLNNLYVFPAIHEVLLVHKSFNMHTWIKEHNLWDHCWQTNRKEHRWHL